MIKIVKGTYGYLDKNGIVKPKTEKDEPFSLTKEQEKRLVDLGVAVYVDCEPVETVENTVDEVETVEYSEKMKASELRKIAKEMGLTFPVGTTKAEMIAAMDEHQAEVEADEDDEDDGLDLPDFDAAEAVE